MAIINRTMDSSEQKELASVLVAPTVTGKDYIVHRAPRAQTLVQASGIAVGLSGAPSSTLKLQRFVAGAGLTTIAITAALVHTAIGTSGAQSFVMPAVGSSLLQLQAGDVLVATSGVANTAAEQLLVQAVVQNVQDIKQWG